MKDNSYTFFWIGHHVLHLEVLPPTVTQHLSSLAVKIQRKKKSVMLEDFMENCRQLQVINFKDANLWLIITSQWEYAKDQGLFQWMTGYTDSWARPRLSWSETANTLPPTFNTRRGTSSTHLPVSAEVGMQGTEKKGPYFRDGFRLATFVIEGKMV